MKKNLALLVSGVVFAIVAIAHLLRIYWGTEIMVSGNVLPMSVSYVGFVVALGLSLWMFVVRKKGW